MIGLYFFILYFVFIFLENKCKPHYQIHVAFAISDSILQTFTFKLLSLLHRIYYQLGVDKLAIDAHFQSTTNVGGCFSSL